MIRIALLIGLHFCTLCCATPTMAGGWLIYHDGPYQGYVLDEETNKPIEGASVVAVWYVELYGGPGGPVAEYFDARESVTNADGWFSVESRTGFHPWPFTGLGDPYFTIYKPGYDTYPPALPILGAFATDEDFKMANEYRKNHNVKMYKNKRNVLLIRQTRTRDERKHVIPKFASALIRENIQYCMKLIDEEKKYLNMSVFE